LWAGLIAGTVAATMWVSLTASFAVGLRDVIDSGFLFRGGILIYASKAILVVPIVNLVGALTASELIPRLRPATKVLPLICSVVTTHIAAYFAVTLIDTQQFVKISLMAGRPLTVTTIAILVVVWIVAIVSAISLVDLHRRFFRV
jgi:hypothetical protein